MNSYKTRIQHDIEVPFARTVYHGRESISYPCPTIWDILPASIKEANSLNSFKKLFKKWVPLTFPCRLCKGYIPGVGFVENLL